MYGRKRLDRGVVQHVADYTQHGDLERKIFEYD